MAQTPNRGYPYPGVNDAPDGPYSFQGGFEAVDADMVNARSRLTVLEAVKHSEWSFDSTLTNQQTVWGVGVLTKVSAKTTDNAFVTNTAPDALNLVEAGRYTVQLTGSISVVPTGRAFVEISCSDWGEAIRSPIPVGENLANVIAANVNVPAGALLVFKFYNTTGGATSKLTGRIRLTKWV